MRQAFQLFDLDDESSNGLKELMQQCLMHPLYLGTEMVGYINVFIEMYSNPSVISEILTEQVYHMAL